MSIPRPKRWAERVAEMPKLSNDQIEAINDVLDHHLHMLSSDHPPVDEAHYLIQQDLSAMKEKP